MWNGHHNISLPNFGQGASEHFFSGREAPSLRGVEKYLERKWRETGINLCYDPTNKDMWRLHQKIERILVWWPETRFDAFGYLIRLGMLAKNAGQNQLVDEAYENIMGIMTAPLSPAYNQKAYNHAIIEMANLKAASFGERRESEPYCDVVLRGLKVNAGEYCPEVFGSQYNEERAASNQLKFRLGLYDLLGLGRVQ